MMNRISHFIAAAMCAAAVMPASADGDVFTSDDARKAMSHAIDLYLEKSAGLPTVVSYYVMPDGSTATIRRIAAQYSPREGNPPDYQPNMLKYFPGLEASFDSIFSLVNGRTPGALGSVTKGDDKAVRVLRFARNDRPQAALTDSANPYDEPTSPEESGDYEQTMLVRRAGQSVEVTHFYSTPPDSSSVSHEPLTELDREFSLLVTARHADVSNVSYNDREESMSGALYVRPMTESQARGVKVRLPNVPERTWFALTDKIMSQIGSNREISVYHRRWRAYNDGMEQDNFVVDYANRVIYAFHFLKGRTVAMRLNYDGIPFLPDDWYR